MEGQKKEGNLCQITLRVDDITMLYGHALISLPPYAASAAANYPRNRRLEEQKKGHIDDQPLICKQFFTTPVLRLLRNIWRHSGAFPRKLAQADYHKRTMR